MGDMVMLSTLEYVVMKQRAKDSGFMKMSPKARQTTSPIKLKNGSTTRLQTDSIFCRRTFPVLSMSSWIKYFLNCVAADYFALNMKARRCVKILACHDRQTP
jgi:hypothetical protein